MAAEEAWAAVFMQEPEVQGVEAMTREETTIRLVARVRPLEQWRTARELRRRIRERLDRLEIDTHLPPEPKAPPFRRPTSPRRPSPSHPPSDGRPGRVTDPGGE